MGNDAGETLPPAPRPRHLWISWVLGLGTLIALVVLVAKHLGEAERFARLVEHAEPWWVGVAVLLQAGTYVSWGALWHVVASSAGHRLSVASLARLAVEKLGVDQLVPTGGLAGNVVVVRAIVRMGLPVSLALETLLIDLLAYYAAFATVAALSVLVLFFHHRVTPIVLGLVGAFAVVAAFVPLGIAWLLRHRDWRPPAWLAKRRIVARWLEPLGRVSPERVRSPSLLVTATLLQIAVFVLDAATLYVMMRAVGEPIHPLTAFVALVMGQIAATVSFLPGGLGSFEAGCTATLTLRGVPIEAALTGTLLLRGLTLWLPLGPGLALARRDVGARAMRPEGEAPVVRESLWSMRAEDVLGALRSRPEGLSAEEAERRLATAERARVGPKHPSSVRLLVRQFTRPLVLLLIAAAAVSAVLRDVTDAAIIFVIVLASGLLSFFQERGAADVMRRLLALVEVRTTVVRDGAPVEVENASVVPGDVLLLRAGSILPADARVLGARDCFVDEALLTGETFPVEKQVVPVAADAPIGRRTSFVFAGTHVVSGTGRAVVVRTGKHTELGMLSGRLATRAPDTDFERAIRRFGAMLLELTFVLVLVIFASNVLLHKPALDAFLFSIALAVGLTPQLLPAIVSVNLARGARRLGDVKVVVKRLASIESFGSMNVLCSDKTGTLTEGRVEVHGTYDPTGAPSEAVR